MAHIISILYVRNKYNIIIIVCSFILFLFFCQIISYVKFIHFLSNTQSTTTINSNTFVFEFMNSTTFVHSFLCPFHFYFIHFFGFLSFFSFIYFHILCEEKIKYIFKTNIYFCNKKHIIILNNNKRRRRSERKKIPNQIINSL